MPWLSRHKNKHNSEFIKVDCVIGGVAAFNISVCVCLRLVDYSRLPRMAVHNNTLFYF